MNKIDPNRLADAPVAEFADPDCTAQGAPRAKVSLERLETLWVNTGTLCNIECANCYIESSPTNDALAYFTLADLRGYLDEIEALGLPTREIGFTGGEPFMNPETVAMAEAALTRGYGVLILTNAMRPMMRPRAQAGLSALQARYGDRLTLRVSLDHYTPALHDRERGAGGFESSLSGMRWLAEQGIRLSVAGRTLWAEPEIEARAGYAALFAREGFAIDAGDPAALVLFPEMDMTAEVPEITTACWGSLGLSPASVMCASARMVVRRKGADGPAVLACTLITQDSQFELGPRLADAVGPVALNHPHCAKFCVLGGARCSG